MKCIKGESCLYCGSNYCRFVDELYQLKEKNEELKKEIAFGSNGTLSDKIRAIVFKDLNKENNKLPKTLAEIKEIAEKQCVCGVDCIDMKQILQKISEFEVENEK